MSVYQSQTCDEKSPRLPRAKRRQLQRGAAEGNPQTVVNEGVLDLGITLSLDRVRQMMEADADRMAGAPKGKHGAQRTGRRHGYVDGYVVVSGEKIAIRRPRVRGLAGEELELPSYRWAQDSASLEGAALRTMVLGVATRGYGDALDALARTPQALTTRGASKSAVSRRFITAAEREVRRLLARPLGEKRYLALYLDGVEEGGYHALVALGLTDAGEKEILGIWEGASENAMVTRELLEDLLARGLDASRGLLVVIDGGKALEAAVKEVLGHRVLIQRCQVHKRRNVLGKLPDSEQSWVEHKMAAAWRADSAAQAQAELEALADQLEHNGRRRAAASLREGLPLTLTCLKIDVDPVLRRSLTNTNPIESVFSRHESCTHRVKRWRNGRQLVRWLGMGLMKAEQSFRTVGTSSALAHLAAVLEAHAKRQAPRQLDTLDAA